MNFGDCPYEDCDELLMFNLPDRQLPAVAKVECGKCQRPVWYKFSRVEPEAWTPDEFNAEWIVDEETKSLRPRGDKRL